MPGADLLHVGVGVEPAGQPEIVELGEQVGGGHHRVLHADDVDEPGPGDQRDGLVQLLAVQRGEQVIQQGFGGVHGFLGHVVELVPRVEVESLQRVERGLPFRLRVTQHVPQFTVAAEPELAGEPDHRRLADSGDLGQLAHGQLRRLGEMIAYILRDGTFRRTQRGVHMVDAFPDSRGSLHVVLLGQAAAVRRTGPAYRPRVSLRGR